LRDVQVHFAVGQIGLQSKLARKSFWFDPGFLERAELGIVQSRFLLRAEPDLHGSVAIAFRRYPADYHIIARRNHGHRRSLPLAS